MIDIKAEQVSKRYLLPSNSRFADKQFLRTTHRRQAFWALRDVSFDVRRGGTRFLANPVGYAGENASFDPALVVEVPNG